VREARAASEPGPLVGYSRALGVRPGRIGLEAGPLSQCRMPGCGRGREILLPERRRVRAALSAIIVKTDRKDARGTAPRSRIAGRARRCRAARALALIVNR